MSEKVGEIYYVIEAETAALLTGAKQADQAMSDLEASSKSASKGVDGLEKKAKSAGVSLDKLEGYSQSMDSSLKTLNTSMSAVATAITQANNSTDAAAQGFTNMNATLSGLMAAVKSVAASMQEVSTATKSTASEFSRSESIIEGLGNQIAILEEAQQASARSAAILAAQLRAGSSATEEEKAKIADLTGRLYDMKTASDQGGKSHGNWKGQMQQAGYQVQDFIVQVQGGQSALVAFSQQGSQLAGAFGPGGAVLGAIIALGSVLTGVLMSSIGSAGNEMDKLSAATQALNKVVNINSQGVAALSNDYARLAVTNATLATQLRDNAIANYEVAVRDAGKAVQSIVKDQSSWFGSLQGGSASVNALGEVISTLGIKTDSFREAFTQASKVGLGLNNMASTLTATVSMLGSEFSIGDDAAFGLAKRLNDLAKNPSPQAVTDTVKYINGLSPASKAGAEALQELETKVLTAGAAMQKAKDDADALKKKLEDLRTESQQANFDNISKQLEAQRIGLTQGALAAKVYAINNQDLTQSQKDQLIAATKVVDQAEKDKKAKDDAAASAKRSGEAQQRSSEQVAQKLANLKQQSELAADSTNTLSREQAVLNAQQSLGKGATQEQIQLAGQYAAKKWDTTKAIKAEAAANKLLPERAEDTRYQQDLDNLKTALDAKLISQQQYDKTAEHLALQHKVNLAKINAEQTAGVTPLQDAQGSIDPVQQLANENARKLALIQEFETEKGKLTANGLMLQNAANTEYEQARMDAAWKIYEAQSQANQMLGDVVDSLQGGATNAITGLINGTQSLQESLANVGSTIISSVVSGLVEMGLQYVKNMLIGQAAAATALASTTAQATAATAAWAPAAMSASIATLGSASAVGTTAYTTALAASKGLAIAGAREHGGPVNANSMYRIGEGGKPEIFKASNGSQYMIPGDSGKVISNRDIGGAGGGIASLNQVMNLTVNTTGGLDNDTIKTLRSAWRNDTLAIIKDQSSRPKGMIQPRK